MSEFDRTAEIKRYLIWFAVAISLVLCSEVIRLSPATLFNKEGIANAGHLLSGFLQPDLSIDYLQRILQLSFESLFVGILGTVMAAVIGVSLCLIAMQMPHLPDPPGKRRVWHEQGAQFFRWVTRFVLGFLRSIPEIVWAYLFVRILGLGPGAAVFAIALTVGGSIGKLYSELAEAVDPRIIAGLRASGTSRWGVLLYGVLPQVRRQWVAYALFRMECNIRTGTVLGVVGAGGLGSEISLNIRYFEFGKLATTLLAVLLFVIALELVSAYLRQKPVKWPLSFAAIGSVASVAYLDIPWRDLFTGNLAGVVDFGFEVSSDFIVNILGLIGQTLVMAWVATIGAALLAFILAPLATNTLTTKNYLRDTYRKRRWSRYSSRLVLWSTRLFLQISRAMPELTLALIFVVWVGPGAFAGILAIAVHNIGVLGRLYTDIYEEVEDGPPMALQAAGTGSLGVWLFGVLPQVSPRILAFTLYRFEVNVRATATVGFVGAGGIGDALHTAISLFHVKDLTVLMLVMLVIVTAVDHIGDRVRRRLLRGPARKNKENSQSSKLTLEDTGDIRCVAGAHSSVELSVQYRLNRKKAFKATTPSHMSVTGMHITSLRPYPSGMVIQLEINVPGNDGAHHALAKVVKMVNDIQSSQTPSGMDVEFINPSPGFLAAIDKLDLYLRMSAEQSSVPEVPSHQLAISSQKRLMPA